MVDTGADCGEDEVRRCLDDEIPGAVNLRDVGGLPSRHGRVRSRRLFRSGLTHELEAEGLARLRSKLGVRTVFDLRNDTELQRDGVADFAAHGILHRRVAVYGVTAVTPGEQRQRFAQMARREFDWCARYQVLISDYPQSFVAFLRALTEPGVLPAVFHCSAGRDRTGVAAALLLSLLGVPDDMIADDYARTGGLLLPHLHRYTSIRNGMGFEDADMAALLHTEALVMQEFLSWLQDAHGGAERFLTRNGLTAPEVEALRIGLLET